MKIMGHREKSEMHLASAEPNYQDNAVALVMAQIHATLALVDAINEVRLAVDDLRDKVTVVRSQGGL